MLKKISVLFAALSLLACQSAPQVDELRSRNQDLQSELEQARAEIDALRAERQSLEADRAELEQLVTALDAEKTARQQESSHLRSRVRGFVQQQIDAFRNFLAASELLDYMGNELIDRRHLDGEDMLLVDLDNPVPRNGTLTGVGAYATVAAPFRVKVLRPIEDELVVIWESQLIQVEEPGTVRRQFPFSVGVEAGDHIAYYFPEAVAVTFDEGTGNTRFISRDLPLGESLRRSGLRGEDSRRAYSLGVFGLLNLE